MQSVQRCCNPLFQCIHFLMFPLFQKYLNSQVRTSIVYHLCSSRLVSKIHPFIFHINSLGLYLSPEWLLNFLQLVYSTMYGKNFKFMVFTFLENALNLGILLTPSFPTQNSRQNFLKTCFPQQQNYFPQNYDLLYQNSFRKNEDGLEHGYLYFV